MDKRGIIIDNKKALVVFNPGLPLLSKNDKEVLELLKEAALLILPIYQAQENHKKPGANFYPDDCSKEEILKAAEQNKDLLSPHTVVEKEGNKLIAIPYHVKYKNLLKPIADKLNEAAEIANNKEFSKRLVKQAEVLLNGKYDEAVAFWMSMKPHILDIVIGPIERYDDKLFFTKTSYQAWVGVMDEGSTKRMVEYKNTILSARRKSLMPSEKVDYYDKVQTRIDDAILFTGLIARTMFVGVNLPNDPNLMEKYGSEITIFNQTSHLRFEKNLIIFRKIFSKEFQKIFKPDDLKDGTLYSTALHELAHTYLRYRDSEKRLEDLFPIIDELAATVMGIRVSGSLLVKDIVTQKQLESIMLAYMCRSLYNVLFDKDNKSKLHYNIGGAIFVNYLFESGAVQESKGIYWPNFTKMFFAISELAALLERLLSQGSREDAQSLIKKYGNMQSLQRFH